MAGLPKRHPGSQLCQWQPKLSGAFAFEAEEAAPCDGLEGHGGDGGDDAPHGVGIGVVGREGGHVEAVAPGLGLAEVASSRLSLARFYPGTFSRVFKELNFFASFFQPNKCGY